MKEAPQGLAANRVAQLLLNSRADALSCIRRPHRRVFGDVFRRSTFQTFLGLSLRESSGRFWGVRISSTRLDRWSPSLSVALATAAIRWIAAFVALVIFGVIGTTRTTESAWLQVWPARLERNPRNSHE